MAKHLLSEHGVVCRMPGERLGYFGWPTVARLDDGTLAVSSSGLRSEHVCPWGKTVLNVSTDEGRTWSAPRVINDSPLDDRDAGIVALGGDRLLVSWFTADTRNSAGEEWVRNWLGETEVATWQQQLAGITDAIAEQWMGSWIILSEDRGANWSAPIRVPVSTPHGPILLRNGELLYLGKRYLNGWDEMQHGRIVAARSGDGGHTWEELGGVPIYPGSSPDNYHEPHVLELPSGRLLGAIRLENAGGTDLAAAGLTNFSIMLTDSDDGGRTWTPARPLGFHGSPPHLLRHSSGALVLTYGYRQEPFGQRVAFSHDNGVTWESDWIIRDDGPDGDLGYPSTIEMADGSLFTLCYQKVPGDAKCSLLWSRWQLP